MLSGGAYLVTVYLDGVRVLAQSETVLPSSVRLAFTAGTGSLTDAHVVRGVAIAATGS